AGGWLGARDRRDALRVRRGRLGAAVAARVTAAPLLAEGRRGDPGHRPGVRGGRRAPPAAGVRHGGSRPGPAGRVVRPRRRVAVVPPPGQVRPAAGRRRSAGQDRQKPSGQRVPPTCATLRSTYAGHRCLDRGAGRIEVEEHGSDDLLRWPTRCAFRSSLPSDRGAPVTSSLVTRRRLLRPGHRTSAGWRVWTGSAGWRRSTWWCTTAGC